MPDNNITPYDYDSIPGGYYDEVFHRRKGMQSKWQHMKFAHVARQIPAGAAHLDIACGPGTFMSTLPATVQSTGLDVAPAQVQFAREKYGAPNRNYELMTPGKLPVPDNSFDIITCIDLIEHITREETLILLAECKRVLKPGGRAIVTTPNYATGWPILEWFVNRLSKLSYEDQHISHYKPASLRALIVEAGLEVRDIYSYMLTAPFWGGLSWKFADTVEQKLEPTFIVRALGSELASVSRKPEQKPESTSEPKDKTP